MTTSSETQAANETSPPATDDGDDSMAGWQLEVFGTWRTLSDTESAQIEKAYCDPNNDTVSMSVVVCMPLFIFSIIILITLVVQVRQLVRNMCLSTQ